MNDKFTNRLDNVKVASPCPANWDEMVGDARKRFCGQCSLNVYNLSGMTKMEAENLLANSEGRLCVRFYQRADGTVLTTDCPVGWQAIKQRVSKTAAAFASLIIGLFSSLGLTGVSSQTKPGETMGDVAIASPTPKPKSTPKRKIPPPLMGAIAVPTPKNTPKPNNQAPLMGRIAMPRN